MPGEIEGWNTLPCHGVGRTASDSSPYAFVQVPSRKPLQKDDNLGFAQRACGQQLLENPSESVMPLDLPKQLGRFIRDARHPSLHALR